MRNVLKLTAIGLIGFMVAGCEVEKEEEGELPSVDVQGGNMPEYDVKTPDVNVTTEERTVTVPDVDVNTEERTVETPSISIDPPEDTDTPETTAPAAEPATPTQ